MGRPAPGATAQGMPRRLRLRFARLAARGPRWLLLQALLSSIGLAIIVIVGGPMLRWIVYEAEWNSVASNLKLFNVGFYPRSHLWRPVAACALATGLLGLSASMLGTVVARDLARMAGAGLTALLGLPLVAAFVRSDPIAGALGHPAAVALLGPLPSSSLFDLAAAFAGGRTALAAMLIALVVGSLAGRAASNAAARSHDRHPPQTGAQASQAARGTGDRWSRQWSRRLGLMWLAYPVVALALVRGVRLPAEGLQGANPLAHVPPGAWGGLLLTMVLSVAAIAASFPLGVLLALGRRSSLPLVKAFSVVYIETIRGVPLVTVLFMAQIMVPLVLPAGPWLDRVFRAMAGFALFAAAYVAEDVRGGLAAVGRGQYDAARAVGLGPAATYRLVVLPQALRVVLPSLVGQFISLFKDTSLIAVVGLNELLGIALAVVAQPEWLGRFRETLVFVAIIYFVFSFAMAHSSRRLEARPGPEA